jgi:GABA permease
MTWRLLVIANETVATRDVQWLVGERAAGDGTDVLVVAPALSGRLAYWASDDARSRRAAEARLQRCLETLRAAGIEAEGAVGDADPLLALGDALALFPADEVVIATHPPGRSSWLERRVVARARARFHAPIHHLVVEGDPHTRVAAA